MGKGPGVRAKKLEARSLKLEGFSAEKLEAGRVRGSKRSALKGQLKINHKNLINK
jgi:hypothetical protein